MRKNRNGFSKVYYGSFYIGTLEETGDVDSIVFVLRRLFKKLYPELTDPLNVHIDEEFE